MKCFYHKSDLDGHCSGAIVKAMYSECEMFPIQYGDNFPFSDLPDKRHCESGEPGEEVFMVDFSLPVEEMLELDARVNLIWIDHHKTAMVSELAHLGGLRRIGTGACALVWQYLYDGDPIPLAVKLLAEYDVWDHSDPLTVPFQYGMRLEDTLPGAPIWDEIFGAPDPRSRFEVIPRIVAAGNTVLKYETNYSKICAKKAFEVAWEGKHWIALNRPSCSSLAFASVHNPETHHGMIKFSFDGTQWLVTLYSDRSNVDVGVIAKHHGGGGHKGAAGFACDWPPFLRRPALAYDGDVMLSGGDA